LRYLSRNLILLIHFFLPLSLVQYRNNNKHSLQHKSSFESVQKSTAPAEKIKKKKNVNKLNVCKIPSFPTFIYFEVMVPTKVGHTVMRKDQQLTNKL
jgi:hypothetical protein